MLYVDFMMLSFFSALFGPVKPLIEERKGHVRKVAVERLIGGVIGASIASFFYWLDLGGHRDIDTLPPIPLFAIFYVVALGVGYLSEMTIYRPLTPLGRQK